MNALSYLPRHHGDFFYSKSRLFWDSMMAIWKYRLARGLAKFYFINFSIHMYIKIRRIAGEYGSKYKLLRASRSSRSASIRVHVEVRNG